MARRWLPMVIGVALLAAMLTACGDDDDGTIEISAFDDFRFDPNEVTVQAGEEVTFALTNEGEIVHEFVLGPESVQMAHEEAMAEGGDMEGMMEPEGQLAAVELEPGESVEVTVTFPEAGEMPFGCHEPGHFDAGMFGTVTIE